jgi:hypothetical protein
LPRSENADAFAATRRFFIGVSALRISSAMPSQNHSWSPVGDRSVNGMTAIDAEGDSQH